MTQSPIEPVSRPSFLHAKSISKRYGAHLALDGVDLNVGAGEIHCLAGENGSGKSTLIKILCGVTSPEAGGEVMIGGNRYPGLNVGLSRQLGIQVIHQHLSLFPNLTVAENVAIDVLRRPAAKWLPRKQIGEIADQALARVGGGVDPRALVGTLPVSQKQLVAIARAMAADAQLIFMDEPTASLAHREVSKLLEVITDLSAAGVATVFVSHRLREVLDIAESVTVLRDGRKVGGYPAAGMTEARLSELMTGHSYDYKVREDSVEGTPLLTVRGLERTNEYRDISLEVRPGEIVGVVGRTGAGRTELALSLFGMTQASGGSMTLRGRPYRPRSNREAISQGVCYLSEDRMTSGLVVGRSIAGNMILSVLSRLSGRSGVMRTDQVRTLVNDLVKRLGIKTRDVANPVSTLSGGNQQRVAIAKWVAAEPALLILDSPTVGVDIKAKDAIYQIVRDLAAAGIGIIIISDEIDEAYFHSHRIVAMLDGTIAAEFRPAIHEKREIEEVVYG